MIAASYPFFDVLWTMVIFFIWILWFTLLFRVWGAFSAVMTSPAGARRAGSFSRSSPFPRVFYLITQTKR